MQKRGRKKMGCIGSIVGVMVALAVVFALVIGGTNAFVVASTRNNLHSIGDFQDYQADAAIVLGASVLPDGSLSPILQDRVDGAIALYSAGVVPKIIMSGDNGQASYNECAAMKRYAVACGVPSQDVFCDHAGFSTYETMYRAHYVFGCQRVVVSTQTYHLYRAIYAGEGLGMTVAGVPTDYRAYQNQRYYDLREIPARTKDFFKTLFKVESTFVGDPIPLTQSGDITN